MSYRDNGSRDTDHNRRSSTSSDGNLGGFRVYVGDLGQRISRTDLEREFGQYGPVTDVWMGRKREVSSPNYAFVVYRYPEDAEEAVRDRNGRKVCGRKVRVEHAKPINSNPRRFRGGFVSRGRGDRGNDFRGNQQGRSRERYNSNRRSRSESPVRNSRGQQSPTTSRQLNDDYNDSPPKRYLKRSPSDSPDPKLKKSRKLKSQSPSPPRQSRVNNDSDSESSSSPPPKKSKKKHKRGHSSSQSPQENDTRQYQKFQEVPRRDSKTKKKSNYVENNYSSDDD